MVRSSGPGRWVGRAEGGSSVLPRVLKRLAHAAGVAGGLRVAAAGDHSGRPARRRPSHSASTTPGVLNTLFKPTST
jgi:hypothetical protein